ncbi:DUF5711 family protein [Paludicola sp. MB14-C6]|uniref:DUF5711 family protein n=1 Tax=Paludihabitans sp. MB14-C6 TaxID=3070656 RepID=UPI0027DBE8BC|nr:DUF5711 family protein [Paludicola sp. MB14-C6]WMJ23299.1 DUF5711 family protein [Paludicola sp. MB14-C6]
MAQYKNIEEYRTKKKRNSIVKKIILVIVIFGILITLLNVLQLFKGKGLNEIISKDPTSTVDTFPIKIANEQTLDLYSLGSNLCVLTKSSIITYNQSGKKLSSISHGYTNPVIKEGNKKILTYDRGGTGFRVDGVNSEVGEVKLENKIIYGQIASNGNVAIITNDTRYASQLIVYDSSLKKIYQYSATELLNTACFSGDNRHVLASSLSSIDGNISVKLYELNINSEEKATEYNIKNVLPLDISYSENNDITIIGKESVVTFNTKSNQITTFEYKGDLQSFANSSSKETVVVYNNILNGRSVVSVIDSNGKLKNSQEIQDEAIDIYCDGSRVLVLGKKTAFNFNMSLLLLNSYPITASSNKICFNGENLFLISTDGIQKLKIN